MPRLAQVGFLYAPRHIIQHWHNRNIGVWEK